MVPRTKWKEIIWGDCHFFGYALLILFCSPIFFIKKVHICAIMKL